MPTSPPPSLDQRALVRVTLALGVGASALAMLLIVLSKRNSRLKRLQQRLFAIMYTKIGLPRLSAALDHHKRQLFGQLQQLQSADPLLRQEGDGCVRILEIGIGSGSNFNFYPKGSRIISVEPNPFFERFFKENLLKFPDSLIVERFITGTAEDMSAVSNDSVDVVVSTHVLCSVVSVEDCLQEIRRVLVPGGRFFYVEHGQYSSNSHAAQLQRLIDPLWALFNDGCRLSRDIDGPVRQAGFSQVESRQLIADDCLYLIRPHVLGVATK